MNDYLKNYKNIVVLGMGVTGKSCLKYLMPFVKSLQIRLTGMDTRNLENFVQLEQAFPDAKIFRHFQEPVLLSADLIIASPGISLKSEYLQNAISKNIPVIGDIELFAADERVKNQPVLAVTGSNGKSTITDLTAQILKQHVNVKCGGNIGVPALDLLKANEADESDDIVYLLELSSFQLETTRTLKVLAACIINISPDHMDRYESFEEYQNAKLHLFDMSDNIIFCRDDEASVSGVKQRFTEMSRFSSVVTIGLSENSMTTTGDEYAALDNADGQVNIQCVLNNDSPFSVDTKDIALQGRHNWLNVMAALMLSHQALKFYNQSVHAVKESIISSLQQYNGLPHRCEKVCESENVLWINDSKATNPESSIAALSGFGKENEKTIIWIAGGEGKDADFGVLAGVMKFVKVAILIGRDAAIIAGSIQSLVKVLFAETLAEAVRISQEKAVPGDVVLFSPACASFDMFNNFEHRGEMFKREVEKICHVRAVKS